MSPKEKAKDLKDKFYPRATSYSCDRKNQHQNAKQCALIAVDEILNSRPCLPICISTDGGSSEAIIDANNFWLSVKAELEIL